MAPSSWPSSPKPPSLCPSPSGGYGEAYSSCVEAFRQFDENGDGVITREELGSVFRAIDAEHWSDQRLQQLMDTADTNGDGRINYEEFIKWLLADSREWDADRAAAKLKRRPSVQRSNLVVDRTQSESRREALKFQVDQSDGRTLGVKVDSSDGRTLLVKSIRDDGLIAQWNGKNRALQVTPGDRIVEINDLRGDARRLMKELKKKLPMDLVVTPSETATTYLHKVTDHFTVETTWLEEGHFSCVRRATHKPTQAVYAVQSLRKKRTTREQFETATSILREIDHPNIVKLFEVFEDCLDFHLVLELCSGGELFERVLRDSYFTEVQAAFVMLQILAGVGHLHGKGVCHRSLRPEHVLLEAERPIMSSVVKIIDFRLARRFEEGEKFQGPVGQVHYMPPEMARGSPYDHTCDLWSCGVMLYLLLSGYPPFAGESDMQTLRLVQRGDLVFPEGDWRNVSDAARELVGRLLEHSPGLRPQAVEAAGHPWIKSCELQGKPFPLHRCQEKMKSYSGHSKLTKVALHEIARRLKSDEIQKLRETFDLLDRNGDKLVTFYELKDGLDKLGKQDTLEELSRVMEEVDLDGSRKIDYTEFLAATLDRKSCREEEALWAVFQVFDRDRSGTISRSELAEVLGSNQLQDFFHRGEIAQVLQECDTDCDGCIDFQEFMAMISRQGPSDDIEDL